MFLATSCRSQKRIKPCKFSVLKLSLQNSAQQKNGTDLKSPYRFFRNNFLFSLQIMKICVRLKLIEVFYHALINPLG